MGRIGASQKTGFDSSPTVWRSFLSLDDLRELHDLHRTISPPAVVPGITWSTVKS